LFSPSTEIVGLLIRDCTFYRNNVTGSGTGAIWFSGSCHDTLIDGCSFVGNNNSGCGFTSSHCDVIWRDCTFAGETTLAQARAVTSTVSNSAYKWRFENCTFGVATSNRVAHSQSAVGGTTMTSLVAEIIFNNCNIADAVEIDTAYLAGIVGRSFVVKHRKDGTTNTHEKSYPRYGTVAYEATTFRTAAPAEKLSPTLGLSTYFKLRSSPKRIPVLLGEAVSVSCYVRKDGTYDGNQPRLVMLANPALGLDDDLVLDTLTVAHSNWEQLSGTQTPVAEENGVVEVVVEVDGTTGNAYVDDWGASSA
jgi:hypothetical protein